MHRTFTRLHWQAIALLLLAATLAGTQLNTDAFSNDELRSVIVAGGAHYGPLAYPQGVWGRVADESPDQALGFPLVVRPWGALVGWAELATRALPFLLGALNLAMVYRIGRDLFSPAIGRNALLLVAASAFYLHYMHKFRVFTLAALAVSVFVWGYWRLALAPRPRGLWARVAFVVGGVGVLYGHYFMVPVLVVVAVYHLLFAPKTRRWWAPVLLTPLVLLAFLPESLVLLRGYADARGQTSLHADALSPLGVVGAAMRYFGNGHALATAALLMLAAVGVRGHTWARDSVRFLLFLAAGMLVSTIALNEVAQVLAPQRVRYLIGLWLPLALLGGLGIHTLGRLHPRIPVAVMALWAGAGASAALGGGLMAVPEDMERTALPWRELVAPVFAEGEPDDLFLYMGNWSNRYDHYTQGLLHRTVIAHTQGEDDMRAAIAERGRVWWGLHVDPFNEANAGTFADVLADADYYTCGTHLDHEKMRLMLVARSVAFCPGGEPMLRFGANITLMQLERVEVGNTLTFNTGWALADVPLNTYTVGFHLLDENDELAAQQDIALGTNDGPYTPLSATFDVSDLPPGTHTLSLIVYDWQTGERLPPADIAPPPADDLRVVVR